MSHFVFFLSFVKRQNSFFFNSKEIGQFLKIGSHFLTESQFCLYSTGPISVTTEFKVRGSY